MCISTIRNVEKGVEGLLVRWTGPSPQGVPGIRNEVKNQVGSAYIWCEQKFCSAILQYYFPSSPCTHNWVLVYNADPGLNLHCSYIAWTEMVGPDHCKHLKAYIALCSLENPELINLYYFLAVSRQWRGWFFWQHVSCYVNKSHEIWNLGSSLKRRGEHLGATPPPLPNFVRVKE